MTALSARFTSWVRRRPIAAAAAGAVSLVVTTAGGVYAITTGGVIYACVDPTTKVMTQSNPLTSCPNGGTKINWNVQGQPGLVWMGIWQPGVHYRATDAVFYPPTGSSYILPPGTVPTTVAPPAPPWQLLAAQGAQGTEGTPGSQGAQGAPGIGLPAIFGTGADGDQSVSPGATLTLLADAYYRNLSLGDGAVLETNGFRIFVSGTLTLGNGSVISADGVVSAGTLGSGAPGGPGAAPPSDGQGHDGGARSVSLGGQGGVAGSYYNPGTSYGSNPGSGGAVSLPNVLEGGPHVLDAIPQVLLGRALDGLEITGGSGGGGGASGPNGSGGVGGSGGGVMVLSARSIVLTGTSATFEANGTNGAAGEATDGCGGGGGGGGVVVVVATAAQPAGLAVSASGGLGGPSGGSQFANSGAPGHSGKVLWLTAV